MSTTEQVIKVRKVTGWQPNWTENGPGEPGNYVFQLILDQGAEEYVLRPEVDDADNLFDWLTVGGDIFFDMERKALIFGVRTLA
jgi:hypothetical protein